MTSLPLPGRAEPFYPESDGKPMADNTLQYEWMVTIRENLDDLMECFVAANLFWYPVEGEPTVVQAPDVMVAIGRPKGHRRSYKQWEEGGVAPQVVFEILSESNTAVEMLRKLAFYATHGVEELYVLDPQAEQISAWQLRDGAPVEVLNPSGWQSPRLGITFQTSTGSLRILRPDGSPFLSWAELRQRAEQETQRAEQETQRAEQEKQRAEQEKQRADRLAARLAELGVDPEAE